MPSVSSRDVTIDFFSSEPLTVYPRFANSSAIPLIPIPPIPTKWTCLVLPSTAASPSGFGVRGSGSGSGSRSGSGSGSEDPEPRKNTEARTRNENPEPRTPNAMSSTDQLQRAFDDHLCRLRLRQRFRRQGDAPPAIAIRRQQQNPFHE